MEKVLCKVADVSWPLPSGLMINMMPFVFGDNSTIPGDVKRYVPLIEACGVPGEEMGRICYLTIREGWVDAGNSQSRGGIHIEAPLGASWGGGTGRPPGWGGRNGLYMGCNMSDTCRAWEGTLDEKCVDEQCGSKFGERILREVFGDPLYMKAGELWWMTDRTPHQALPQKHAGYRQFFRLVTSEVSVWYSQHNTPNPLGVAPCCPIVHHNKFEKV